MSTVPADTSTVVPVACSHCGADMTFTVEWRSIDHRCWSFHCTTCLRPEGFQHQRRHQLWANQETIYVGSYWGPEDVPIEIPQPNSPTMNLLHPERRGFFDGIAHLFSKRNTPK